MGIFEEENVPTNGYGVSSLPPFWQCQEFGYQHNALEHFMKHTERPQNSNSLIYDTQEPQQLRPSHTYDRSRQAQMRGKKGKSLKVITEG